MPHDLQTIPVRTVPPYEVLIGSGLLGRCGTLLRPVLSVCRMAVITDSTVAPLYLDTVTDSLRAAGYGVNAWTINDAEMMKYCVEQNVNIITNILRMSNDNNTFIFVFYKMFKNL